MIAIIDYNAGNIRSVCNSLNRLNADWILTDDHKALRKADKVILPGVGSAGKAMISLRDKNLVGLIKDLRKPLLGICVGLQILTRFSEEEETEGIGLFDTIVRRFTSLNGDKIPHMGWNTISNLDSKLFKNIEPDTYVYYVHSYRADLCSDTIATTDYCGEKFSAALKYENFYGTQFHPEKSGNIGEMIIKNFLEL